MNKVLINEAFEVLQDRENYIEKVAMQNYDAKIIWGQVIIMALFSFLYGTIMGSYNSLLQALVTGVKLWMLIFLTLLICFPSFYIIQMMLGSKVRMKQLAVIMLSGFVITTTILIAFAPIVLFFQLSGDNYNFLQLLHVFIFCFAGFFGMRFVLESLKAAFEKTGVYPKIGLSAFRVWVLIFAFVGLQLSWNLRSFLGTKEMPFELFRKDTQGNIYTTIFNAMGQMFGVENIDIPAQQEK